MVTSIGNQKTSAAPCPFCRSEPCGEAYFACPVCRAFRDAVASADQMKREAARKEHELECAQAAEKYHAARDRGADVVGRPASTLPSWHDVAALEKDVLLVKAALRELVPRVDSVGRARLGEFGPALAELLR